VPPLVFMIVISTDTYNGTRTVTTQHDDPVTDTTPGSPTYGQQTGTVHSSTTSDVPVQFDHAVFTLTVTTYQDNGTKEGLWQAKHTLQNEGLCGAIYSICLNNRHPVVSLIGKAADWIHAGGLNDPLQGFAK
jgi:hypothetical protein